MQYQRPVLQQQLGLKMNAQLIQSIQLLALPLTDLRQRIEEELEQNPALAVVAEPPTLSWEQLETRPEQPPAGPAVKEREVFENSSDSGFSFQGDEDAHRRFLEGVLAREETLQDHLVWQLRLQPLPEDDLALGEVLIHNLDPNGFHREDPQQVAASQGYRRPVEPLLQLIRRLDPEGCGVKDHVESLLVQMDLAGGYPPQARKLVSEGLELVERRRWGELASLLRVSEARVHELVESLRPLNPFPGRLYGSEASAAVVPDVSVFHRDGELILRVNEEDIPVLGLDPEFLSHAERPDFDKEARAYVSQSLKQAEWFLRSLKHRRETLTRVAYALLQFQKEFFVRGPKALKPLTLKDVAAELELSEATISRITTGKYMQTEWGLFELKKFFSNSISGSGSGGSPFSAEAVKEILREILVNHKGEKKLTDKRLSELLQERGIPLAIRTVNKYRNELESKL